MELAERINKASSGKLIFFLCLVGFLVYANSLFNGFVWDDEEQIVKNPLVQNLGNLPQIFTSSTFYGGGAAPTGWFYRPIMTLSFLLNYSLWGGHAFGFHLFAILIHLLNASLVFWVLTKIFSFEKIPKPGLVGFLVALVYVVHPGNVEAVAYIAALQESLYTLFSLLILFVILRNKKSTLGLFFWTGLLALLAFLSKEAAVFLIPLVAFFTLLFIKEKLFGWLISSTLAFLIYLFLRLGVAKIPLSSVNVGPIAESSLGTRLASLPYEMISYLRIILFPKDLFISQHTQVTQVSDFHFWGYLIFLLIAAFALIWLLIKKRSKVLLFFAFWFIGSISLVLNIIPLDMSVAERWLYFPLIGFLGMMALILAELVRFFPWLSRFGIYLVLIIVILFGLRTTVRNTNWHDGLTLYAHDIRLNPEAFDLQNNYGVELFRAGKIEEAKEHFQRSIELYPRWWFAYNNLGVVYQRQGDLPRAQSLYEKTLEISDYYLAYENLAFLMLRTAKPPQTISFVEKAIAKLPGNISLWAVLSMAYYKSGDYKKAEDLARQIVSWQPSTNNQALLKAIIERKVVFE